MTYKRKSSDCYSERHKRRLLKQETEQSISRIKQTTPLEQTCLSYPIAKKAHHSNIDSSFQNFNATSNGPDFENVPSRTERHDSNVDDSQDSANKFVMDSNNDTNIAVECLQGIETHVEIQDARNANIAEDHELNQSNNSNHSNYLNHSNQSNESESSEELTNSHDISSDLCQWIDDFRPPRSSVNALLRILRKHTKSKLPKDYRSLLRTPRTTDIHSVAGGHYWHNGLEKAVKSIVQKKKQAGLDAKSIRLMINIDGAPIGKSSQYSLWPILCSDDILKKVYVVGVFYGERKPTNSNQFLDMFINDAVGLVNNGLQFDNEQYDVRIEALICDAPAKAFVLEVKYFNGYNSCNKCNIEGEYVDHTMCFPSSNENISLRTDENFKNYLYQDDYQTGRTNLCRIPHLGLVTNIPLDYMHLICLGTVKKLLMLWLHGPLSVRLSAYDIQRISRALVKLRRCVPSDFVRKPRSLKFVKLWKATEYRQFLLYLGPVVLKNVLKKNLYEHFLILHAAITILVSPSLAKHPSNVNYAAELLKYFVESFENIYGVKHVSHNVHNLLHLADDVRKFGPLDEFSAFRFENHMSSIIKLIRKGETPLQQIARRLAEYDYISTAHAAEEDANITDGFRKRHYEGPLTTDIKKCKQYKVMRQGSCLINCNDSKNDCCMLKNETMVECVNFVQSRKTSYVIGYELVRFENLYSLPCESDTFDIKVVKKDANLKSWPSADICLKLMKIPLASDDTKIAVFPVLHTSGNH